MERPAVTTTRNDRQTVLVLHESASITNFIALTLNHGQFTIRAVQTLDETARILGEIRPSLALVDMDHPGSTEFLQRVALEPGGPHMMPVIGLTRRGDLSGKLRAFDLGASDILTVPFSPEELLARSILALRKASGITHASITEITMGEITIDIVHRDVRAGSSVAHLTGIEQSLLYFLASRAGQVVSREEILDAVWGPNFLAESNVVDRHIRSVRAKLQGGGRRLRLIETVHGKGYRFIPTFSDQPLADPHEPRPDPSPGGTPAS